MLQAFNPNKNIMSALINQYTFKHLKNKAPSDFICIEPFIYNGIKSDGKGATFRITFKDADGNNTGKPFDIQTPPVNLYFPNIKGTHQGKMPKWANSMPTVEEGKRIAKFQVDKLFPTVNGMLQGNGVNTEKLLDVHREWIDWVHACQDECATQIFNMATSKEFRAEMKNEGVSEGVVHDVIKDVKLKTSLDSFKDNFKSGLIWEREKDKEGNDNGYVFQAWTPVQASRGRPSVSYPVITKKLVDEEFTQVRNITPSDETLSKAYIWNTDSKKYSYVGNELDEQNTKIEPDIVKHNQVAVVKFEPRFYAAPIRGFKLVLKQIHIMQDAPNKKRKIEETTEIEDEWAGCM